jgi:DNA-binding MarR family transcriptional regulator
MQGERDMSTDFTRKLGPSALGARLRRLSERIDEDAGRIYAELGVAFEQRWWGVMEHLFDHGPASVGELARALGISHPSVSQTRRSLEAAGLVEAQADALDGRSRRLALSPAGRDLYQRMSPVWAAMDAVAIELNGEAGDVVASLDRLDQALARSSLHERIRRAMQRAAEGRAG